MPPDEKVITPHEGALNAMNEALGEPHGEDKDIAAPEGDADAGADSAAEEGDQTDNGAAEDTGEADGDGEGKAPEGEAAPEGGEADAERPRNADGTFKSKEQLAAEGLDDKGKPKASVKQPDPLNDPIPKDLKKETSERIQSVIKIAKEATAERDQIKQNFDYLVEGVQKTGTTPEQYGEVLSWMALFNSNDPAQQTKALELVEDIADRLATMLGKERTVADPLTAHPDLVEAVRTSKITAQYAKEIARTRNSGTVKAELTTAVQKQQQDQNALAAARDTARTELSALEGTLRATDPQYERKKAILVEVLKPIFKDMHPSQWKAKFEEAYRGMPNVGAAPVAAKVVRPGAQPMRPGRNNASGGKVGEPKSMLEAMNQALGGR